MDERQVRQEQLVAVNVQPDSSQKKREQNSSYDVESCLSPAVADCAFLNTPSSEGKNRSLNDSNLDKNASSGPDREVGYVDDDDCIIFDDNQVLETAKVPVEEEIVDISPSSYPLSILRKIPQNNLAAASKVKQIYVFDNSFSVLPPSIIHFKGLESLKLFSNEVRLLPREVGNLTNLQQLHVKVCPPSLETFIPLSKISALKTLELHQTPQPASTLALPVAFLELQALTRLSICHFSISSLPSEIGTLKNLKELDLSFNKLKTLPKEIVGLRHLKILRVASNKLSELPCELSYLSSLESIDVAYNRITSLMSLRLESMTSLKTLNVQFNRLQAIGDIPKHLKCCFEGNEELHLSSFEIKQLKLSRDFHCEEMELLFPQKETHMQGGDLPSSSSACKAVAMVKDSINTKSKPDCKKLNHQEQRARQDQLWSIRNTKEDNALASVLLGEDMIIKKAMNLVATDMNIEGNDRNLCAPRTYHTGPEKGEKSVSDTNHPISQKLEVDFCVTKLWDSKNKKCGEFQKKECEDSEGDQKTPQLVCIKQNGDAGISSEECCSSFTVEDSRRQALGQVEHSCYNQKSFSSRKSEHQGNAGKNFHQEQADFVYFKLARNRSSKIDINPKPSKRRKSSNTFLSVSYKYCKESFCGFQDRLVDGFYDAGRDRPFLSLDVLEEERLSYNSREVILVDRERDEDLAAIAMSAKQLLTSCSEKQFIVDIVKEHRGVKLQNVSLLALYVSDCFGGSDKTLNVTNMRRATLGSTAGAPFVCSCMIGNNASVVNNRNEACGSLAGLLPSLHMLCDEAVKYLKSKRGSNVLPIGSLPYGVCRHRAILLKYLCDSSDPIIPCELIRGYLDYTPHAWNVALVVDKGTSVRVLVDACRPLDIRPENDPEYFCRYIPFKRIDLRNATNDSDLLSSSSEILCPVLHEEIGRGASGAVVHRCTFGRLVTAAKVRQVAEIEVSGGPGNCCEKRWLSELQMLSSVGEHSCIVKFYGHELSLSRGISDEGFQVPSLKIFMEYISGSSLEALLKVLAKDGQRHMPLQLALQVAQDVASALVWLHSRGIIHRDIKSSNVLIDFKHESSTSSPVVKLCDFDSAVHVCSSSVHSCYLAHHGLPLTDVCVGTPRWLAPEVLNAMYSRHPYGLEVDMWSFGCLLVELLTLTVPYAGLSDTEVHNSIQRGQRPKLPPELEPGSLEPLSEDDSQILNVLVETYERCTEASPTQRPTAMHAFSMLSAVALESDAKLKAAFLTTQAFEITGPSHEKMLPAEESVETRHHLLPSSDDPSVSNEENTTGSTVCSCHNRARDQDISNNTSASYKKISI